MADDMLNDFKEESAELLQQFEDNLLLVQDEGVSEEAVNGLFRSIHTIKGVSGMFNFSFIVEFAHVGENLLDKIRNKEIELDEEKINIFLNVKDHLERLINAACDNPNDIPDDESDLIRMSNELSETLGNYIRKENDSEEEDDDNTIKLWKILLKPFKEDTRFCSVEPSQFIDYLNEIGSIESIKTNIDNIPQIDELIIDKMYVSFEIIFKSIVTLTDIKKIFDFISTLVSYEITPYDRRVSDRYSQEEGELEKVIDAIKGEDDERRILSNDFESSKIDDSNEPALADGLLPEDKSNKTGSSFNAKIGKSVKSKTLRVDSLRVDSLINLIGEMVIANANVVQKAAKINDKDLLESTSILTGMLEDLREQGMKMRMLPIGETFNRFKRIVHDASKKLNKNIDFHIYGGETELDKTVIEKINDPLVHIIRNSIDHGIEDPSERKRKGKPEKGIIKIGAYHEAGSIAIEITDDGKGLDPVLIFDKAVQKNLVDAEKKLTNKEIFDLIFMPGFSTAEEVSDISGRGVGMEVVKKNIDLLRGDIEIESEIDEGTKITIRLPLTLAIIDGFLISVENTHFVVPLDMILECIELSSENNTMHGDNFIDLRGNILPLFDMGKYFETDKKTINVGKDEVRKNIVIVQYAGQMMGLVVDKLLGEFQTVIKPLGKVFKNVKGLSGATILGSGEVALILDVPILSQHAKNIKDEQLELA